MTPPQFFDAIDYEHAANATLPLRVKQDDGTYKIMDADISEGNLVSYIILKDVPIPKVIIPTGLDKEGRPTAIEFWGKGVPVEELYDDEYAKYHDIRFLHIVERLKNILYSNPELVRANSPIAPKETN